MKFNRMIPVFLAAGLALALFNWPYLPAAVKADIGWPPLNPSGSDLVPPGDQPTQVRMVSEEVNISIEPNQRPLSDGQEDSPAYWMRGQVDAQFLMRNLGQEQESFDVWFPLAASMRYPGMLPYFPEATLQDFTITVDDIPLAYETVPAPDLSDPQQNSPWAKFPMVFPPGKDVIVRVSYTLYPTGRRPFGGFEYILQTGAGWKGTISSAKITISLPFEITSENLSMADQSIEGLSISPNPPGYEIEGNVIRWQFTDLEPTAADNIFIDVLEPQRYQALLDARQQVLASPNSVDAQLNYVQAAQNALLIVKNVGNHGGGETLAKEVDDAYKHALELNPQREDIYSEYANWMLRSRAWISLIRDGVCPADLCDLVERGLALFPDNADLLQIQEQITLTIGEAAPQPIPASTNQPEIVPSTITPLPSTPTSTTQPTEMPTPIPVESQNQPPGIAILLGAIATILVLVVLMVLTKRNQ